MNCAICDDDLDLDYPYYLCTCGEVFCESCYEDMWSNGTAPTCTDCFGIDITYIDD